MSDARDMLDDAAIDRIQAAFGEPWFVGPMHGAWGEPSGYAAVRLTVGGEVYVTARACEQSAVTVPCAKAEIIRMMREKLAEIEAHDGLVNYQPTINRLQG